MKKKILHHTSIMIIFAVLVTFLAASVVTYSKLNTYMQRGVREEAQYICLAMDEYGDSFLTKKLRTVSSSRVTLIRKDGTVLYDSEASPKKLANHSDRPEFIQAEKNGKSGIYPGHGRWTGRNCPLFGNLVTPDLLLCGEAG